ncbi:MAG: hypothetical protein ABSG87_01760 [Verrucomicrobiota bacterium]|jgi:hypothetical protein
MKQIFLLLAIAILAATGCRSTDNNGTDNTSMNTNSTSQYPASMLSTNRAPIP